MKTTLELKQFPSGASVKCKKAATWVRSDDAKFEVIDEINICQNPEKFDKEASKFTKLFLKEAGGNLIDFPCLAILFQRRLSGRPKPSDIHVTAVHIEEPTNLPVESDWVMYLIPLHIVKGPVEVDGQQLNANHYCHLTDTARVVGHFYAELIIFKMA